LAKFGSFDDRGQRLLCGFVLHHDQGSFFATAFPQTWSDASEPIGNFMIELRCGIMRIVQQLRNLVLGKCVRDDLAGRLT
jgi:hypothetical protein